MSYDRRTAKEKASMAGTLAQLKKMESAIEAFKKASQALDAKPDAKTFDAMESAWHAFTSEANKLERAFGQDRGAYDLMLDISEW